MKDIHITIGSRITYSLGDDTLTGTVYAINRRPRENRKATEGPTEIVYSIAESNEVVPKSAVTGAVSQFELNKNIVVALLGQDALDNLRSSQEAVRNANTRPTFKPKKQRYAGRSQYTIEKV